MREDWEKKTLGEIATVSYGFTGKALLEGEYRYVRITDISDEGVLVPNDKKYVEYFEEAEKYLLKDQDLLMARTGATFAKVLLYQDFEPSIFASYLIRIKFKGEILNKLYWYFSKSHNYWEQANSLSSGAAQPHFNGAALKKIVFTYPNFLQEQQQIVNILDEAFEAIDQAIANIEQNIVNAQELFQSKLNEIFSQRGEGWEEKTLGEVCFVLNGYAFKSRDTVEESNTQLLRMGNLYKNVLDLNRKPVFYPDSYSELYKEYLLEEGDLIMSLTGTVDKTDYGYTVKVPSQDVNLLLNQRIMKIDIDDPSVLNKDYLKNYLLSPDFLKRLYATASGTRQANLSSRKILDLNINFPVDIEAQKSTVKRFKKLRDFTSEIEFDYKEKLEHLQNLKKSILQKAFSGELTNKEVESLQLAAEPREEYFKVKW